MSQKTSDRIENCRFDSCECFLRYWNLVLPFQKLHLQLISTCLKNESTQSSISVRKTCGISTNFYSLFDSHDPSTSNVHIYLISNKNNGTKIILLTTHGYDAAFRQGHSWLFTFEQCHNCVVSKRLLVASFSTTHPFHLQSPFSNECIGVLCGGEFLVRSVFGFTRRS